MPVLIILCILLVWAIIGIKNALTTNHRIYDSKEMEEILTEMLGKSEKECRKILKQHRNRR